MTTNDHTQPPVNPVYPTSAAAEPTPVQRLFAWSRRLGVVRPDNRVFGGVASAVANRVGLEPWIMRLILLALIVLGGLSVWFYIAAWTLLPEGRTGTIPLERWIS